ncbi:MAG: hypothetical protein KDK36_09720, partial [Leptospiraceae bacterium]|nr:hypothetical protein [Leptospiraceae bacterium]
DMEILKELEQLEHKIKIYILVDSCKALPLSPILKFILINTVNLTCMERCRKNKINLKVFPSNSSRMMHLKSILFVGKKSFLISGQANFTPNSFNGAWLETNIYTEDLKIIKQFKEHFKSLWEVSNNISKYKQMNLFSQYILKFKNFIFLLLIEFLNYFGLRY